MLIIYTPHSKDMT